MPQVTLTFLMSGYKRLQRQQGGSSSDESFYPSSPKKLKFDYEDIAPDQLLSPSSGEGKMLINFTEFGKKKKIEIEGRD